MRWTIAPVSSSESLLLKAGMSLPFPFFIDSVICSSVCAFCHSGWVKSGCPFDFQLGKPTPSLPWHNEHRLSYKAAPSAPELPATFEDALGPLAAISFCGANNKIATAAESAANARLFLLVIYLLPVSSCSKTV